MGIEIADNMINGEYSWFPRRKSEIIPENKIAIIITKMPSPIAMVRVEITHLFTLSYSPIDLFAGI